MKILDHHHQPGCQGGVLQRVEHLLEQPELRVGSDWIATGRVPSRRIFDRPSYRRASRGPIGLPVSEAPTSSSRASGPRASRTERTPKTAPDDRAAAHQRACPTAWAAAVTSVTSRVAGE